MIRGGTWPYRIRLRTGHTGSGQENVVMVYRLIVEGTIEDNIVKLQEKKKELADQILGGEGMGSASFTREELKELLK